MPQQHKRGGNRNDLLDKFAADGNNGITDGKKISLQAGTDGDERQTRSKQP
jgi:hypothetical protein